MTTALAMEGKPRLSMPTDFSIAIQPGTGVPVGGFGPGERRQPMRGYEDTYVDIVDYIVRITDRIWEDQDVGYIYDTYSDAARVHDDRGLRFGVEPVVEATLHSLAAFPDVRHYADDVIWAGDEDTGFYTSHRALNVGYHTGRWKWGPATGRSINLWVIANCVSRDNKIFEEWVLHNTAARLQQAGVDVHAAARTLAEITDPPPLTDAEEAQMERLIGGRPPVPYPEPDHTAGFDVENTVRALFHNVYNRRDLSAVDRAYQPNATWHGPTNRAGTTRADVKAYARNLLGTFPDLGLTVDEVYWMGNDTDGYRAAVRWSAAGTHRGHVLYGPPTGHRARLWGLSQLYFRDGLITEDWSLFNEFEVLVQLLQG